MNFFPIWQLTFNYYQNESVENYSANPKIKSNNFKDNDDRTNDSEDVDYQSDSTIRCDQVTSNKFLSSKVDSLKLFQVESPRSNNTASKDEKFIDENRLWFDETKLRQSVQEMVKTDNLDEIGNFILNGFGDLLLDVRTKNHQIQEFLDHLPIYLVSTSFAFSTFCSLTHQRILKNLNDNLKFHQFLVRNILLVFYIYQRSLTDFLRFLILEDP